MGNNDKGLPMPGELNKITSKGTAGSKPEIPKLPNELKPLPDPLPTLDFLIEQEFPHSAGLIKAELLRILDVMKKGSNAHPKFPTDIVHMTAIVAEEAGEAVRAANHCYEKNATIENVQTELRETAGTCIRTLIRLLNGGYRINDTRV